MNTQLKQGLLTREKRETRIRAFWSKFYGNGVIHCQDVDTVR